MGATGGVEGKSVMGTQREATVECKGGEGGDKRLFRGPTQTQLVLIML